MFFSLCLGTIYYLLFGFTWHPFLRGGNAPIWTLSLSQFCHFIAVLVSVAVLLPSLISTSSSASIWLRKQVKEVQAHGGMLGDYVVRGGANKSSDQMWTGNNFVQSLFGFGSILLCALSSWTELLVLEQVLFVRLFTHLCGGTKLDMHVHIQDWQLALNVPTDVVYPTHFLFLTSGMFVVCAMLLYKSSAIG
jgi:hypothetical protein